MVSNKIRKILRKFLCQMSFLNITVCYINVVSFNNYLTDQLDGPARRTSCTDQLDGPAGQTCWTDQLDGPAGRTSWTDQLADQLDRPAGRTSSFYLKPWPVRIFEDFPFSLYIVAASESDEGLVLKVLWWGTAASLFGKRPSIFHLLTITDKVLALFCPRDWEGGDSRSQTVHIFIFLISWSRSGLVLNIMFHCRSRFLNELQFWQVWEKIADNSFSSKIVFFTNFCLRYA